MKSWILLLFFMLVSAFFIMKYIMLKRDIQGICKDLKEKLSEDTNLLLTTVSSDKKMKEITVALNEQLKMLQNERHRFQQGDQELKEAITNISHDIRTPLTAMNGYLDLIEKENENANIKRYLTIIKNRSETIEQLMNELFQYSIVVSENEISLENVTVNAVLEESILSFYAIMKEKDIMPKIHISEKKVVRNLNKDMLYRVFSNLMQNAIRHSDGDLEISLSENGVIVFSNHASKLTQVQVSKLFNRFYTVEEARNSTGLGLSIAKTLIENMNGRMKAEYKEDKLSIIIEIP